MHVIRVFVCMNDSFAHSIPYIYFVHFSLILTIGIRNEYTCSCDNMSDLMIKLDQSNGRIVQFVNVLPHNKRKNLCACASQESVSASFLVNVQCFVKMHSYGFPTVAFIIVIIALSSQRGKSNSNFFKLYCVYFIFFSFFFLVSAIKCWRCSSDAMNAEFCNDSFDANDSKSDHSYVECIKKPTNDSSMERVVCKKLKKLGTSFTSSNLQEKSDNNFHNLIF